MVYLPMGNQPPDQWGGKRSAAVEKYSSSVVALDLATGKVRWVFQTVHHDLWDYDVPSQPTLVDLTIARRHGAGAGAADQAGRTVRARSPHRRADRAGHRSGGAAGRRRGRPQRADPAQVRPVVRAAAPDRARHVGRHHARPAGLPHRLPAPALRRPLHAAVDHRLADLPGQFRRLQLGRRGGRPAAPGRLHHAGLPGVRLDAGRAPRRQGLAGAGRRRAEGRPAGAERKLRRAVRGAHASVRVAARHPVPGAALGLRRRRRPRQRQDRLAHRNGTVRDLSPSRCRSRWACRAWAGR